MISIIVERPPADRQGDDISDDLLTSATAAVERGRNEIDASCSNRELISSSGPLKDFIRPGALIEVGDMEQQVWRGMVKSVAITVDRTEESFAADINLVTERGASG
jgi:hypothetical protein